MCDKAELKMKAKPNSVLIAVALLAYWVGLCNASAFYDPSMQRWLNRDPLGELGFEVARTLKPLPVRLAKPNEIFQAPNLYEFVRNNSVHYFDSFGLHWSFACASIDKAINDAMATAMYDESFGNYSGFNEEMRKIVLLNQAWKDNGCDDPPPSPPACPAPSPFPVRPRPGPGPTEKCAWVVVGVGLGGLMEYAWVCVFAL
jgi:hypothetical protein